MAKIKWHFYDENQELMGGCCACYSAVKFINSRPAQYIEAYFNDIVHGQGWYKAATIKPDTHCRCGRSYLTPNGTIFMYRSLLVATVKDTIDVLNKPAECAVCHYSKELQQDRFCPQWVRTLLDS